MKEIQFSAVIDGIVVSNQNNQNKYINENDMIKIVEKEINEALSNSKTIKHVVVDSVIIINDL